MSNENENKLEALRRKEKRVKNAIKSQSKRLKSADTNGSNIASIKRTLNNSKEALVRIQSEIDVLEPKAEHKPKKINKDKETIMNVKLYILFIVVIATLLAIGLNT